MDNDDIIKTVEAYAENEMQRIARNAAQWLDYQLRVTTTEMKLGDSEFYDTGTATQADRDFVNKSGGDVKLTLADRGIDGFRYELQIPLESSVTKSMYEAVTLSFDNMKKMLR